MFGVWLVISKPSTIAELLLLLVRRIGVFVALYYIVPDNWIPEYKADNHYGHPFEFSPACVKTAKDLTKWFYDIVSSSFAVIAAKKNQRYHLQRGHGVSSKVEGRGGNCDQAVLFNELNDTIGSHSSFCSFRGCWIAAS